MPQDLSQKCDFVNSVFAFDEDFKRVIFKDTNITVFPLKSVGENGEICYSFLG